MSDLFDLSGRVSVDLDPTTKSLSDLQKQVQSLTTHFEALDKRVSSAAGLKTHTSHAGAANETTKKLSETFRALASSAVIIDGPLGGVAGRLRAVGAEASELGGAFGPIGIGIGALVAGGTALGFVLFELAEKSAEFGKRILETSEKTNLSTEAVSGLGVAGKLTNLTIEQIGNSFAKFNTALGNARDGNKELSRTFAEFGGTAGTTDQVLDRFLKKFKDMGPTAQRNALEAKVFRDRTGELIPLFIELGGSLEEAKKKAEGLGVSFDEVGARRAKAFADKIELLKIGIEGLGIQIGERTIPAIETALDHLASALGLNENSWRAWGEYLGNVMAGVVIEASAMAAAVSAALNNLGKFKGKADEVGNNMLKDLGSLSPNANWNPFSKGFWDPLSRDYGAMVNQPQYQSPSDAYTTERNKMISQIGSMTVPMGSPRGTGGGGGGGGGRGGGGDPAVAAKRLADLRLKYILDELNFETDANKRALDRQWIDFETYRNRFSTEEEKRHKLVIDGLAAEMVAAENIRKANQRAIAIQEVKNKQQQEEFTHKKNLAKVNDEQAKLLDQIKDFMANQVKEINYASSGTDQYTRAVLDFIEAKKKEGVQIAEVWCKRMLDNAARQKEIELIKEATRERYAIPQRPRVVEDDNFWRLIGIDKSQGDETRPRRTTDELHGRMLQLAGELTSVIDNAIHTGFQKGVKAGLADFALGILQMIEQKVLARLTDAIADALTAGFSKGQSGGSSGGGGGFLGFLSKIIPFIGSALGAGLSGGGTKDLGGGSTYTPGGTGTVRPRVVVGSHAMGLDYVPYDGYIAELHKGERVLPASQNKAGGDTHNHYHTWNVVTRDAQSFGSRETQRQIATRMSKVMRKAALA